MQFQWKYPPDEPDKVYETIVRKNKRIGRKTFSQAQVIGAKARMRLAPHSANNDQYRRPGERRSEILVEQGSGRVDSFVTLHDPDGAALIIEGKLRILRGAIGA